MNIILFSRKQANHRPDQIRAMWDSIHRLGFDYAINSEFVEVVEECVAESISEEHIYTRTPLLRGEDILVTYGGDGTLLEAVGLLSGHQIPVVGINCGRLGYLTADDGDGIELLFERIAHRELSFEHRSMLRIEGDFIGDNNCLALNEVAIHRHGATMVSVETLINGNTVATYHGDGLVVSTPTGSTAYSLSAGGPIVEPEAQNLLITPICPHDMLSRCVVASQNRVVTVELIKNPNRNAYLSVDGGKAQRLNIGDIEISFVKEINNMFVYFWIRRCSSLSIIGQIGMRINSWHNLSFHPILCCINQRQTYIHLVSCHKE